MQLTEQQFYLLIIALSTLVSGILVYGLNVYYRKRERTQFNAEQDQLRQHVELLKQQLQQVSTEHALAQQQIDQQESINESLQADLKLTHQRNESLIDQLHTARSEIQQMQVIQQKERQHNEEKLQQLENARESLTKEFKSLSEEILKVSQKEFKESSRQDLDQFLQPFRQQISDFKSKVENIHTHDLKQREELKTELKHLQQLNQQITAEAHQLSTALKGQKKTQGNWGELILENVLDRSGLRPGKDYQREVSFTTESGRRRPDVIVYLPDEKHLIIDAKVSLNAYTRYVNSEDEIERSQAIKEHIQALSARINELSDRNYFELPGLKSPEMVFMFIPIESAFVEAIRNDESLFQMAVEKQVLVTTPTTLLTSLNIVRQLWRFEDQNKYAAKLADSAAGVYSKLSGILENLSLLGRQLEKSRQTYDNAMKQFASGKGNLIKRVEDFQKLGVSVQKEMPAEILEKARLELDLIEHPENNTDENANG